MRRFTLDHVIRKQKMNHISKQTAQDDSTTAPADTKILAVSYFRDKFTATLARYFCTRYSTTGAMCTAECGISHAYSVDVSSKGRHASSGVFHDVFSTSAHYVIAH